ncbi:MAG: hypothetical protein R2881_00420 [Eubacteriales bacterium]
MNEEPTPVTAMRRTPVVAEAIERLVKALFVRFPVFLDALAVFNKRKLRNRRTDVDAQRAVPRADRGDDDRNKYDRRNSSMVPLIA